MTKAKYPYPPTYKTFGLALQALQALFVMAKNPNCCPSNEIAANMHSEATLIRRRFFGYGYGNGAKQAKGIETLYDCRFG